MTTSLKYFGIATVSALVAFTSFAFYFTAHANPSFFTRQNNGITTTASTSIVYMTPGTATTTYYLDSSQAGANSTDSSIFDLQFMGSSTASIVNVAFEYAMPASTDCIATPTSCDWYNVSTSPDATTTQSNVAQGVVQTYSVAFASTTVGGAGGISTRTDRLIKVITPVRYTRAVITMPIGSLNGAVWGEFVAKRQAN